MLTLTEMDPNVGIRDQMGESTDEPVALINVFHVDAGDVDAFLKAWKEDAEYFKAQPGFISGQLHRGIAGSATFLNYAVWESVAQFRAAFANPAFQAKLGAYPDSASSSPHLFRKLAVSGICIA
jgi:heme-degrading monooxygenase HmoA